MRVILNFLVPLLAAGTVIGAIAVAPVATASQDASSGGTTAAASGTTESHQSCVSLGSTQTQCQSPGNAQLYDAPPQVDYYPYAGGAT
jgi:hypothetical protein